MKTPLQSAEYILVNIADPFSNDKKRSGFVENFLYL